MSDRDLAVEWVSVLLLLRASSLEAWEVVLVGDGVKAGAEEIAVDFPVAEVTVAGAAAAGTGNHDVKLPASEKMGGAPASHWRDDSVEPPLFRLLSAGDSHDAPDDCRGLDGVDLFRRMDTDRVPFSDQLSDPDERSLDPQFLGNSHATLG